MVDLGIAGRVWVSRVPIDSNTADLPSMGRVYFGGCLACATLRYRLVGLRVLMMDEFHNKGGNDCVASWPIGNESSVRLTFRIT